MVAYLVSLYNVGQGNNTSNNQIQEAIWTILDPSAEEAVIDPSGVNAASYMEQAVSWYTSMNGNQAALNSFLSNFEIVSDPNMTFSQWIGNRRVSGTDRNDAGAARRGMDAALFTGRGLPGGAAKRDQPVQQPSVDACIS